jgi:hypothetical protein
MRLYDVHSDADPLCISNENSEPFTGIDYDPEHQQVRGLVAPLPLALTEWKQVS